MRKCIDGNGADVTALLAAYLQSRAPLYTAELYQIRAPRSDGTPFATPILLTGAASPLIWSVVGKFLPAVITHSPIETTIGLEAQEVTVDWAVAESDTTIFSSDSATPVEPRFTAFREGLYDHGLIRIWRTYMAESGNSNQFGAVMQFQGRIADVEMDALGLHLQCPSVLECLNRKIPPNLIENANINAAWLTATNPTTMVVLAGSTAQLLLATVQGSPTTILPPGYLRYGYVYFPPPAGGPGQLAGHYRQIQDSFPSGGVNAIQLMEPLPFPPNVNANLGLSAPGEVFQAFAPHPQSLSANDPAAPGYPQYMGFQFVPRPEDTI